MDNVQLGQILRVGGAAATVGVGTGVQAAAQTLPLGQVMAFRAGISGLILLAYGLWAVAPRDLLPRQWRPHLIRGALSCGAMWLTFVAFASLPITQAQTLTFLAPLIMVPMAVFALGEVLSARRIFGLLLGFAGVLMILGLSTQAGPDALWGAVAGICGAVLIALVQITVRSMTATETTISIALSFTLIVATVAGTTALAGNWVWPLGPALGAVLAAGVFGALNVVLFTESLARAPASAVAPMDYTGLVWALLVDWLLFAQLPGGLGILGSVLITAAALIVVLAPQRSAA